MPRSPEPTGAVHDNAPETGDNPDQATPPPSADGDHLPVIEPSDVRVTVDATTDDTEPVPDGSASAIGGRDTITVGSAMPGGAVDATTAGATTPAGEVNALTNNITAGTAMPVGAVSAVTGITPDTSGDDTSEESDDIPSEDSGQFRAALDAAALRTAALYAISRRVHPSRPGWRERENPSGPTEKSHGPALDLAEVVEALRGGADGIPAMNDEQIAIVIVDFMPLADAQLAQLATSFHSLGRLADRMREDTQDDYSPRAPTSLPVVGPTLLGALLELRDYRGGMTVPTVCHLLQAHTLLAYADRDMPTSPPAPTASPAAALAAAYSPAWSAARRPADPMPRLQELADLREAAETEVGWLRQQLASEQQSPLLMEISMLRQQLTEARSARPLAMSAQHPGTFLEPFPAATTFQEPFPAAPTQLTFQRQDRNYQRSYRAAVQPAAEDSALSSSVGPAAFDDIGAYLHAAGQQRYVPEKLKSMPNPHGVERQIKGIKISELPTWSGNSDGDLADHYATTAKMCYLVPDLSSHFTYIMYMTLRGKALVAVDLQNASLGRAGRQLLHTWGEQDPKAQGIMFVLLESFPVQPKHNYLKMLRQLPQLYFRDAGGGQQETLPRYRQRFRDHVQEADQDIGNQPLASDFQLRLLYVSGLPKELQAYVVSDPSQSWYNPQLTASQAERFYEGVEAEGRRRELAGEPTTLQDSAAYRSYARVALSPTAKPPKQLGTHAADIQQDAPTDGGRRGGRDRGGRNRGDRVKGPRTDAQLVAGLSKTGQELATFIASQAGHKVGPMMSQLRTELNIKYCLAKDLRALSDANATKAGLVIAAGYNKGALEGDNNVRRFTPTFRPEKRLLIDDDGQDLIERLGSGNDAYAKVVAIQPADFHRHPDMFKRHFLKTAAPGGHPSAWTPACIICCGLGHQGFACGPYAALCKARNEAVPSGMLASYSYAYGCAPTRNSTTAAGQLHLTSLAQSFLSPDVGDPVRQPLKSSEVHLHGYSSAFPRTCTRPAVSQLCFETFSYPHLPHGYLPTYCPLARSLPLLPKVRHDIVDVGFVLSPPILRPRRSLVGCIISFVFRVSLHLYPACDDLPICDRLQHPSAHRYDSCVFDMSRVPWRSGRSALVTGVLRVIHHQRSYLVARLQLQPIWCRIACSPR